ncbi:MAG: hypothetical protein LBR73_08915 [Oscillospiraceae bacterium]|jgi:hypothetical protein|nr:hypothetical protein [Oscillospiraceae bacterium]
MDQETNYSAQIFLKAALPLVKVIAMELFAKKFEQAHCIYQISAIDPDSPDGKIATHFTVNNGEWVVCAGKVATNAMVELEFKTPEAFVGFMKGDMTKLPKMKGAVKNLGAFLSFMQVMLKMSALLGATKAPEDEATKSLLVKCMFYLLSSGISTLNKAGHPAVTAWTKPSPDRVYSWAVNGHPEVSAYVRIKAGKSRAGRGDYKRALPFFTMRFDCLDSALGTLLGTDDLMEATKAGRLIMDGAPEFGAQLGDYMLTVAAYAK